MMIEVTSKLIDTAAVLQSVQSNQAGAAVLFVGSTRQFTNDRETLKLEYECYESLAIKKMTEIQEQAAAKWKIEACSIVHRIGTIELGEASIAVAVSSPHRADSFEAGRWLVDTLKTEVPIWKQEHWADGSTEWVHPEGATPGRKPPE